MELIEQLRKDTLLSRYICDKCEENNVGVVLDEKSHYIVLNPELYYQNQHLGDTANMVDCFIVQHCINDTYKMILVELKNITDSKRIAGEEINIKRKFQCCVDNFMLRDFKRYFDRQFTIELYFISKLTMTNAYSKLVNDIDKNIRLRALMNETVRFRNKQYFIKAQPNNFPIQPC